MFGISFPELMIIALLVLVVAGPEKLPELARMAGKGMRELRKASNTLRDALLIDELDLDIDKPRPRIASGSSNAGGARVLETGAAPASDASEAPATRVSTASAPRERYPSAEPSGLDQMDERDFDRLVEQQYLLHHNQLKAVALAPALPTSATLSVELRTPGTELQLDLVPLSPSQAPEPVA